MNYVLLFEKDRLTDKFFNAMTTKIDFNSIMPRCFLNNEKLLRVIHRSNITSEALTNIIFSNPDSINHIDVDNFEFKQEDIIGLLIGHPKLLAYFNIDFNKFSIKQLIRLYSENIDLKEKVDFSKYEINQDVIRVILSNYIKRQHVVELINFNNLDGNGIRLIIKNYDDYYIDKLPIQKMKPIDWLDVLKNNPGLIKYCDIKIFEEQSGCYYLAELITMYDDLDYLIEKNKDKFNALACELLIMKDEKRYLYKVDQSKLKQKNWSNIVKKYPHLTNKYIYSQNS